MKKKNGDIVSTNTLNQINDHLRNKSDNKLQKSNVKLHFTQPIIKDETKVNENSVNKDNSREIDNFKTQYNPLKNIRLVSDSLAIL